MMRPDRRAPRTAQAAGPTRAVSRAPGSPSLRRRGRRDRDPTDANPPGRRRRRRGWRTGVVELRALRETGFLLLRHEALHEARAQTTGLKIGLGQDLLMQRHGGLD